MQTMSWHPEHARKVVYDLIYYALASKKHDIWVIYVSEEGILI